MKYGYGEIGFMLRERADEANDAFDHDEIHAAAEVARMMDGETFDVSYIDRWLAGIAERLGL